MKKLFGFLFLVTALIACKDDITRINQKNTIPKDKFIDILVGIHLTDAITAGNTYYRKYDNNDSVDLYSSVFEKYKVTKAEFDSTVAMYSRQPEVYLKIYDEVLLKLNYILDTLKNKNPQFPGNETEE